MPASAIAEPFALSRPDPRQDAGRGRANDDGFRAALGAAASPGISPARTPTATLQPSHAVAAGGGTPATGVKTKSTSPSGPRPIPPTPGDPATTPAAPCADETAAAASPDGTVPGSTAPDPPAGDFATSPATDTTAAATPLLHAGPGAGAPLPARHDGGLAAAHCTANTEDASQAVDQSGAIDPTLVLPPAPPLPATPVAATVLAGTQAGGSPGPADATGLPAVPGTALSAAASTGAPAVASDTAIARPAGLATPSALPAGQAADASIPGALSTPPDFAAALHAAAGASTPRRSPAAPATSVPAPSGATTRPASTGPASVGPAATASATSASTASDPSAAAQARTTLPQPSGMGQPDAGAPGPARRLASIADPADAPDAAGQPSPVEAGTAQTPVAQTPVGQAPVVQDPAQVMPLATAQAGLQAMPAATPVPATPPAPSPAGPAATPAAQLVPAVLAMHTANGAQNMMLRLTPAELGTVQVQITRDHDGTTSVSVLVERPETLRLLLHDQAQLQHALSQAGLSQDRTLSLQQAPPGSFASQDHRAPAHDLGQDTGRGAGGGQGDGQAGRDSTRQGFAQGQGARSGPGRPASGVRSYASAWQTAGVDITA